MELVQVYFPLTEKDKLIAESFKLGYERFGDINLKVLYLIYSLVYQM